VFCDTNDGKIGKATVLDHDNMVRELGNIACFIDYDFQLYDYLGDDCGKQNLIDAIGELEVEPQDVVVFFYSGHGARAMNNESDPLPQMCLGSSFDSEFVPLQYVINKIADKKPKLLVSITNCCNKEDPMVSIKSLLSQATGPTDISDVKVEAYKKLFKDYSGQAIITSSEAGQYSWCSSAQGGLFIVDMLDVLYLVGQGTIEPNWEDVMSNAKQKTSARIINTSIPPYKASQIPYYINKIRDNDDKDKPRGKDGFKGKSRGKDVDSRDEVELSDALSELVDHAVSVDERLEMVPGIFRKYFTANAKVRTLGRNGMTVDYEPAKDFLRRVALSRRIARITVINKKGKDKYAEISVHEIQK
jgi:hypothetical protein